MKLRKLKRGGKKKKEQDYNPHLQKSILEAVDNQLNDNDPPEASETLQRLLNEGYSESGAKKLIASALIYMMWGVMKEGKEYNAEKYIILLNDLPSLPD
jgi:hypothetical protein